MIDPPYRLDPYRRIINVGWLSGSIVLVLQFEYVRNFNVPLINIQNLMAINVSLDAFKPLLYYSRGPINPLVENPVFTPDMIRYLYLWNRTPFQDGPNADRVCQGRAMIFMSVANMIVQPTPPPTPPLNSFSFDVTTPAAGGVVLAGGEIFYVFSDPVGDLTIDDLLDGSQSAHVFGVFDNAGDAEVERAKWEANYNVRVLSTPTVEEIHNAFSWTLTVATYKKKLDFPSDAGVHRLWDLATDLVSLVQSAASGSSNPSYTITVTVTSNGNLSLVRVPA